MGPDDGRAGLMPSFTRLPYLKETLWCQSTDCGQFGKNPRGVIRNTRLFQKIHNLQKILRKYAKLNDIHLK